MNNLLDKEYFKVKLKPCTGEEKIPKNPNIIRAQ